MVRRAGITLIGFLDRKKRSSTLRAGESSANGLLGLYRGEAGRGGEGEADEGAGGGADGKAAKAAAVS